MSKPVQYMQRTKNTYDKLGYPPYRWFEADAAADFAPVSKGLANSKLGLIASSGAYVEGQVAFHYKDDTSIRTIARDTPINKLRFSHITENYLPEARQDPGTVLPLQSLAELQRQGVIGELADEYYSCMGGIYSQNRVKTELIPNLAAAIDKQQLDLLLLVPL
ncbi:MAG: glycine/betaine/sarcosine/D-proline family reductase selenoprotein B [Pseudomonadales bacterium]|nr:glycine/betaine/sarcosine/D-proline family reductase selenoprotein B [Pseudomonadales bacterium]